ncbi:hypothetical protein VT03_14940 [Planctomyces sp. SH-PL14]|nr:hypothetical protein VT03_14940 [Planctomyces sp. SH-PL14]
MNGPGMVEQSCGWPYTLCSRPRVSLPTAQTLMANSDESVRASISKFPQFFLPILFAAGGRLSSQ